MFPIKISGAMQYGVPAKVCIDYKEESIACAKPKSKILAMMSLVQIKIFAAFKSLCTKPYLESLRYLKP